MPVAAPPPLLAATSAAAVREHLAATAAVAGDEIPDASGELQVAFRGDLDVPAVAADGWPTRPARATGSAGAWAAAHKEVYQRTTWLRAKVAGKALAYRDAGDPNRRYAPVALAALAIWQSACTAGVLVDDVTLAEVQQMLCGPSSELFAQPLPEPSPVLPDGWSWADLDTPVLRAQAGSLLAEHAAADTGRTPSRGQDVPLRVGDAVRTVRSHAAP
ncbi:hypothetical protein ACFV6F_29765 [Kitasatospora phosalacinea]|uniref:hypothetical protein n=1 Tax=Kitasatospora phosalacinea TaxID=2065 RepID=UPI00364F8C4A